tara:strand:+ start:718 stop:1206 length:489 start_codon:yes stop_codon:yes gene_type:complete
MVLNNIKFLRDNIKHKYRNTVYDEKEYFKRYVSQKKLEQKKKINVTKLHLSKSCKKFHSQIIGNKKNLLSFYKKFNIHLRLKNKYDQNLKAKSRQNACLQMYLILLNEIYISDLFNDMQKLNSILKINDLIVTEFSKDYINFKLIIKNNFEIERKLIRKVLA